MCQLDKVSVYGCREYAPALLDEVIGRHFEALEADGALIHPGDRVLIKPNLVMRRAPEEAATTHPEFVAAVIRAVKRRGGVPVIAESPGGPYTRFNLRSVYAGTGIEEAARREGAELSLETGYAETPAADPAVCSSFPIIDPVRSADVVLSVAKLKTHCMTGYSGAVKNLFGVIPGLMKPEFHYRFPDKQIFGRMLVDLCETVKPAAAFIDGIVGMEGNGPTGGRPKFLGVTAAARNPHALDLLGCTLIGMDARDVPTLSAAMERGLCPEAPDGLDIVGDRAERFLAVFDPPESRSNDFLINMKVPGFIRRPLTRLITPRPAIVTAACVGCGKCAESCPEKTIRIRDGRAVIDYSRCIRCFCCHEMCPQKAVAIRKFRLFGL